MKVTITIEDEVHCNIHGLKPDHNNHFYKAYGILTESYFFNPKYKLGSWDGKIRYFHATGQTHIYLLTEIIPTIVSL
ncbi:MAG: hypothetical protein KUG64_11065, partial [Cycloclasticus sp.]|nr:hypothetical protein [Cycloclasticus sp.]